MKIGIISDSHEKNQRMRKVLELLCARGAEAIVHCGDLADCEAIELLGRCGADAYVAAGNGDRSHATALAETASKVGVRFAMDFVTVPLGNDEHLAATHGHWGHTLEDLIGGEQFRYVCHGHFHHLRDERIGPVRVLSPGALYLPKGDKDLAALLLDTDTDEVEVLSIP